jgi:UPF0755 protein
MRGIARILSILLPFSALAALVVGVLWYAHLFGPAADFARSKEFLVVPEDTLATIAYRLKQEGIVRSELAARIALSGENIVEGGYQVSAAMDTRAIAKTLASPPFIVWLTFPSGFRKEQIADRLAGLLSWSAEEREAFTAAPFGFPAEGVYFPGTYLIRRDEAPGEIAERMRERFRAAYAPYAEEAARQGLTLKEVVTLASMISREAAGPHDMPLIAGVMHNRLASGMPLGIDANLQYINGTPEKWWPVAKSEDKFIESPYNTYFRKGLPAGAIASPGMDEIKAALFPEDTSCYYYLHDYRGEIHCSANYSGHLANIDRYLR